MPEFVNYSVSSLRGCRPGVGAGGYKISNKCTRVHVALSCQVSCLSCIFTMGSAFFI